jgi:hypothetical protein
MSIIPEISDFDLEIINILIKKKREEANRAHNQPFLPILPPQKPYIPPKKDNNTSHVIIIDI